jgi:hypothetical protein
MALWKQNREVNKWVVVGLRLPLIFYAEEHILGKVTDLKRCIHYSNDMKICDCGFGDCGTEGKYNYAAECGTAMFKSIEQCLKENGLYDRINKAITTTQP